MDNSNNAIWDCVDKFSGKDVLPRRYSDTKDPSEMTADEFDGYIDECEFKWECAKDDRMMESIDDITFNEREWE